MVHVLTDATFEQETSQGLVLVDFGQLGVVLAGCRHQSWNSWQKRSMKMT